jgi:hypothetical protein
VAVTNLSSQAADITFGLSSRAALFDKAVRSLEHAAFSSNKRAFLQDLPAASRFSANLPPFSRAHARSSQAPQAAPPSYAVDTSAKSFLIQTGPTTFTSIPTTLRAQGAHCNIWVANDVYGGINPTRPGAMADAFEQIYLPATKLLGYEYGGDPADPGTYGGVDGDPRVQILVYDAGGEDSGLVGFFWPKDEFTQAEINSLGSDYSYIKTNLAEMFYIDSWFFENEPQVTASTLVHEFQHMINFNQKTVIHELVSETWYNEMLSMLAEDVIGPKIGILPGSPGHPSADRISYFLDLYWFTGVDTWFDEDSGMEDAVIISYSLVYGFGAYLVRNYGGPRLIQAMSSNGAANHDSITQALRSVNGDNSLSFETALERYAEAFVYSTSRGIPPGKMSFDKTVTSESINGEVYTATGFDIWEMWSDPDISAQLWAQFGPNTHHKGPFAFPLITGYTIEAHTLWLHDPQNLTGTLSLTRPGRVNVKMTLLEY